MLVNVNSHIVTQNLTEYLLAIDQPVPAFFWVRKTIVQANTKNLLHGSLRSLALLALTYDKLDRPDLAEQHYNDCLNFLEPVPFNVFQ